ncbi:MAG: MoaD/ThiS family protein [Bacteroidota bacterium]
MAKIIIPTPLRKFTENLAYFESEGATVGETINHLVATYPDLGKQLLDGTGSLRTFVNVFVGDEDIRALQKESTPVEPGTVISIVPAIAGGAA